MKRFKQISEAARFMIIMLFATLVFPSCDKKLEPEPDAVTVNIATIQGVTNPVTGATPTATVTETEQYTGAVTWTPAVSETFAAGTEYTATITLTAKSGFTFIGVAENFFTVDGVLTVRNAANSGIVTAKFHATDMKSGTAGKLTWKITSDGTLIISGTGDMPDYESIYEGKWIIASTAPWFEYRNLFTAVMIEDGITSIGSYAFILCSNLTSAIIGNSVRSIGYAAFYDCSNLASVITGNSIESIELYAFWNCVSLLEFTIPNSVTTVKPSAFNGCSSLTSVTIPSSVVSIGETAFSNCDGLMSINVDAGNSAYCSENGVLFDKAKTELIQYPARKTGAYIIPESVGFIEIFAFRGCKGLTEVTIPKSVIYMGQEAFTGCSNLNTVYFNAVNCRDMGYVGKWAVVSYVFSGCNKITTVHIGSEVTKIPCYAFYNCSGLQEIINQSAIPQEIGIDVFYKVDKATCTLRVPAASIEAYRKADDWKDFVNIVAIE